MIRFAPPTRARRMPSLTPMIDVVFLLLVFFMLAAQFGREAVVPLGIGGGASADYSGPPRLVEIAPEAVTLNGLPQDETTLAAALSGLTERPDDTIVLRAAPDTRLQRLVDVAETLRAAGFTALAVVE